MRGEKKQSIFLVFLLFLPLLGEAKRGFSVEDGESAPSVFQEGEGGAQEICPEGLEQWPAVSIQFLPGLTSEVYYQSLTSGLNVGEER